MMSFESLFSILTNLLQPRFLLECKKKSLSPETITSLKIIIKVGYTKIPEILLLSSKIISKATIKILSAIGSRNFPKFDSYIKLTSDVSIQKI